MNNLKQKRRAVFGTKVLILLAILLTGCVMQLPNTNTIVQSNLARDTASASADDLSTLVAGNSAFAFDLYQALRTQEGANLFYSPYSISLALAMTYAGAEGETAAQMAQALHYTLPESRLHPAFNALDTTLSSYGEQDTTESIRPYSASPYPFQLNIANAIWGQKGFSFLPEFLDLLAQNYGAGLRLVDFVQQTEVARQTINNWVSNQTQERIQELIAQDLLTPDAHLVLTNAIYFKASWRSQFEAKQTKDAPFTLLDGSTVTVPMMSQTRTYRYAAGDGYQAIALPYDGADVSMLIILPNAEDFGGMEAAFGRELIATIDSKLSPTQVHLSMPKFTFESQFALGEILGSLGMPIAFSAAADFSGMTGARDLAISEVVHKAFVDVDETGTEAAAATAIVMRLTSISPQRPAEMKVDHPFLFLIRDEGTGAILFVGRVLNPMISAE